MYKYILYIDYLSVDLSEILRIRRRFKMQNGAIVPNTGIIILLLARVKW